MTTIANHNISVMLTSFCSDCIWIKYNLVRIKQQSLSCCFDSQSVLHTTYRIATDSCRSGIAVVSMNIHLFTVSNWSLLFMPFNFLDDRCVLWLNDTAYSKRLKVSTFIYRHLQGNPDQQRFTTRSGLLSDRQWHKWRSASSDRPLPEWTEFGPRSLQL